MSYASYTIDAAPVRRTGFLRSERLITVIGASAFGAMIGFGVAVATGRADMWAIFFATAFVLAIALYPASANMADASWTRSQGCKLAAMLHLASLLAWPLAALFGGGLYWIAPLVALSSLLSLASCWSGASVVVYRMGLQGLIIAGLAANQGTMLLMGA
jgi:hypothetical protein